MLIAGALGCSDGPHELELRVVCEDYRGLRPSYAVTPGSELLFALRDSQTREDVRPSLDLVDAPGFTLSLDPEEEGFLRAVAPLDPGVYTWTIEGSSPAELLVYVAGAGSGHERPERVWCDVRFTIAHLRGEDA